MLKSGFVAAALFGLLVMVANRAQAQQVPPAVTPAVQTPSPQSNPAPDARGPNAAPGHKVGGFVPGQKRPPGDPAQIARGKTLFGINCRGCHGADLRGGDMGGPNLLRSQVALSDQDGELIVPIIQGSRQTDGHARDPDRALTTRRRWPLTFAASSRPSEHKGSLPTRASPAPSILVGNASEGKAYFAVKCGSCHSPTGDLQGIATKISDPKMLQTAWVAGGERRGRGEADAGAHSARTRNGHRHACPREKAWKAASCGSTISWSRWSWLTERSAPSAGTATCRRLRSTTR